MTSMLEGGAPGDPLSRQVEATPTRVLVNVVANYLGRGWTTVIGLVCLPMFFSTLGREAYGLIGAFAVIQAWALLLDFGLTPTLNREIVRTRAGVRSWQSLADLVRTIEVVVLVVGSLIALTVLLGSSLLAAKWLNPRQLQLETVEQAIAIMGVLAACRWTEQIYRAAIQGSEDQVWLNVVQSITETARWLGALLVIHFVKADILYFFGWNLIVSLVSLSVLRLRVVQLLRQHAITRLRLRPSELLTIRRFAAGMFLSSILSFLLTQTDKLVVGSFLSLADFGIYALVATAAAGLLQLVLPMNVAILPRFTALVEADRRPELAASFHVASQSLSAIVLPIALTIAILPEQSLLVWTGHAEVVAGGAPILSLLMFASVLNAVLHMPYMLQLAHGWTEPTNKVNACALILILPVLVWATGAYAGMGAAASMAGLNLVSLLVMSFVVLQRLLPHEFFRWFRVSVLLPLTAGLVIALGFRFALPLTDHRLGALVQLITAGFFVAAGVLACLPQPRQRIGGLLALRR